MASTSPVYDDRANYRKDWIFEIARRCQIILSDLANDVPRSDAHIQATVAALPAPANKFEEVIFLGLILEAVIGSREPGQGGHLRHRHDAIVKLLLDARADASRRIPPVERAAAAIELSYVMPFSVADIAKTVGCHESILRRRFRETYSISMREYHIRVRVRSAIAQFLNGNRKTSSVSALIGYRSEKNFYHAVRDITGLTPARLAALSPAELRMMLRGLVPHARQHPR